MAREKPCFLLSATFCAIAIAQICLAQPGGRGVISGIVVEGSSGDPVRKAVVTVTWQGTPRAWATTRTDGDGRFTVEGLPAGKYDLRAVKPGLGTAIYGANSVRELGDLVTLAGGENRANLKLRFLRSGSISGRVVDHDGDPIQNVQVNVLRSGRNLGERVLSNYRSAQTNDRGEYKITGIDPGQYYLFSRPNNQMMGPMINQPGSSAVTQVLIQQYYGGSRDSKDAAALTLRGGEAITGIDFHLNSEQVAKITGRITGVPQVDPPQNPDSGTSFISLDGPVRIESSMPFNPGQSVVVVNLSPADDNAMFWGQGGVAQGPDYHFEMPENAPGRYRIQATFRAKDKTYYASQIVDAGEGITDVVLTMAPAVNVKGHLKVEGPGDHPVDSFTVVLAPGVGQPREQYSSHVAKDGSFAIDQVPPGEFTVNVNPSPLEIFDKSVQLGDKDFLYKRIEIAPGSDASLNIVISSNTAAIEGEVDAGGADGKRAGILLEPIGKWHTLARFYYSVTADDSGKFKVNVAPGTYKVFALEKIATSNYRNVESGELLGALGEEIEVTEGAKITSHPKLIPEEQAREILKP